MTNGAHWLRCACQRAPEITAQAGRGGAQASPQEGAAGSFLPMTPLVTPTPITPASERLGPQSHKFLLSLDCISTTRAVCQEPYNYFYHLTSSIIIFITFFSQQGYFCLLSVWSWGEPGSQNVSQSFLALSKALEWVRV